MPNGVELVRVLVAKLVKSFEHFTKVLTTFATKSSPTFATKSSATP